MTPVELDEDLAGIRPELRRGGGRHSARVLYATLARCHVAAFAVRDDRAE